MKYQFKKLKLGCPTTEYFRSIEYDDWFLFFVFTKESFWANFTFHIIFTTSLLFQIAYFTV